MMHVQFQPIIDWYRIHARVLPWRKLADPYAVWVSEVMLQQTTVATVIPYFERFMDRWPTIEALAACELEDVLHSWQGLGYYRRARYLHAAARIIVIEGWPHDIVGLQKLPGIGSYTARAIMAIAFNASILPIDGNIVRILARVLGLRGIKASIVKQLEKHDWGTLPDPAHLAQALMDLGQAICTPRDPLCDQCPLQAQCCTPGAQSFDREPVRQRQLYAQAFCMPDDQGVLISEAANISAPSPRLLEGLWGPLMTPWRETPYVKGKIDYLHVPSDLIYCGTFTHVFSHIRLMVDVYTSHQSFLVPRSLAWSRLASKIIDMSGNQSAIKSV